MSEWTYRWPWPARNRSPFAVPLSLILPISPSLALSPSLPLSLSLSPSLSLSLSVCLSLSLSLSLFLSHSLSLFSLFVCLLLTLLEPLSTLTGDIDWQAACCTNHAEGPRRWLGFCKRSANSTTKFGLVPPWAICRPGSGPTSSLLAWARF